MNGNSVRWTDLASKALVDGGWVDLHTEYMTLVLYVVGEEPLVTTVEPVQLPTAEVPWFKLGAIHFDAVSWERVLLAFTVSNDRGQDVYRGILNETVNSHADLEIDGISAGIRFD